MKACLFLLSLLNCSAYVRDCLMPVSGRETDKMQCMSGQVLLQIPAADLLFQPETSSERKFQISTFYVAQKPTSTYEYHRYLQLRRIEPEPQLFNLLAEQAPSEAVKGLKHQEAQDFCHSFGQTLPTEAELELLANMKLLTPGVSEWSSDWFREPLPQYVRTIDPQQIAPSSRISVREPESKHRLGLNPHQRYDKVVFRCVSRGGYHWDNLTHPGSNMPTVMRIESDPPGAKIYADRSLKILIGSTPLIRSVKTEEITYTFTLPGHQSQIHSIKAEAGIAKVLNINLKEVGPMQREDYQRQMPQVHITSGPITPQGHYGRRVHLPGFYLDAYRVSNQQYREYAQSQNLMLPRCNAHDSGERGQNSVTCVSWDEAYSYCSHFGKSLPTALQMAKVLENFSNAESAGVYGLQDPFHEWLLDWVDEDSDANRRSLTRVELAAGAKHKRTFPNGVERPMAVKVNLGFRCVQNSETVVEGLLKPQDAPLQSGLWWRP